MYPLHYLLVLALLILLIIAFFSSLNFHTVSVKTFSVTICCVFHHGDIYIWTKNMCWHLGAFDNIFFIFKYIYMFLNLISSYQQRLVLSYRD